MRRFSIDAGSCALSLRLMNEHCETTHSPTAEPYRLARSRGLTWLILFGFLATLGQAIGQALDEDYLQIYYTIQEADTLNGIGQPAQALAKYQKARKALENFRAVHPDWNSK